MNTASEELFAELPEDVKAVLSLFDDSYRLNAYFTWDSDYGKKTGFMDMHATDRPMFWSPGVNNPKDELVPAFIEWVRGGMLTTEGSK